jgi:hypothetical protein
MSIDFCYQGTSEATVEKLLLQVGHLVYEGLDAIVIKFDFDYGQGNSSVQATLHLPYDGRLGAWDVKVGDRLTKGTPIATIDTSLYEVHYSRDSDCTEAIVAGVGNVGDRVKRGDAVTSYKAQYTGDSRLTGPYPVNTPIGGTIHEIGAVKIGDQLTDGMLVAVIDPSPR